MSGQLDLFGADLAGANRPESASPDSRKHTCDFLEGLNEQQRQAVCAPAHQALQVLAGAGTGKTELISRRFVKLVRDFRQQGIARPAERILVVTFTNDAALAMRDRINRRLMENGEEGLNMEGSQVWISTFHQLCMRLLRTHPLAVGLPPDFIILNPLEQQVLFNRLLHGVLAGDQRDIGSALDRAGLQNHLPADLLSLEALEGSGLPELEALLEPVRIFRLLNRIKTTGLSPAEFLEQATAQTRQLTERLKALPVPHDPQAKSPENMQLKIEAWQGALKNWACDGWNPILQAENKAEASGKKVTAGLYRDELKSLADLYLAPRSFEPLTPDFSLLDEGLRQELKLIELVAGLYALYQNALLAQGACDFDDLINHTIRLLAGNPALRERYRRQFEAVIVDEFQDSNGSQLRLLELLVRNQAENLTVVGDEKQSIYAFRFAQPENLDLIFRHGPYQRIHLQTNYRSAPPVLSVSNRLTESITDKPGQQLNPCEALRGKQAPKVTWLDLDTQDEVDGKSYHRPVFEQKALEAHAVAVEIARLVRNGEARFRDVAVLVKSHAKAESIQKTLADFGIPAIRQKNLGFFQESVVKDALALLRLMQNPADDVSLVRILQGKLNQRHVRELMRLRHQLKKNQENALEPAAGNLYETCLLLEEQPGLLPDFPASLSAAIGDLASQLQTVRKLKPRLNPAQVFLQLADRVGLIDRRTPEWQQKQQRITLRTFERLLYLFSRNKPLQPTLEEVLETLDQYAADPNQELPVTEILEGEDAVRIMTVFAAKGLEFPVVFACYTEKAQTRGGQDDAVMLFDPQYAGKAGFGLILGKINGLPNPKYEVYRKCWQSPRSQTEAQRVFYVALTRAMQRLYVFRGSQSFPWTAPEEYPAEAIRVLSETGDEEYLAEHYWNADAASIREEMSALQEA